MSGGATPAPAIARNWWLRAPAVLVAPRAVFVSLRDTSPEAIEARTEPITAIVGLAGIAAVLGTPVARTLLNDSSFSVALIPVWAFLGGALYALALYWLGGGLLYGAARRLGGLGTYRRARQTLALATAPLALSLVTFWPVRIAVYGQDLFRTGGNDYGRTDEIFGAVCRMPRLVRVAARRRRPLDARLDVGPGGRSRGAGGRLPGADRRGDHPAAGKAQRSPAGR